VNSKPGLPLSGAGHQLRRSERRQSRAQRRSCKANDTGHNDGCAADVRAHWRTDGPDFHRDPRASRFRRALHRCWSIFWTPSRPELVHCATGRMPAGPTRGAACRYSFNSSFVLPRTRRRTVPCSIVRAWFRTAWRPPVGSWLRPVRKILCGELADPEGGGGRFSTRNRLCRRRSVSPGADSRGLWKPTSASFPDRSRRDPGPKKHGCCPVHTTNWLLPMSSTSSAIQYCGHSNSMTVVSASGF
jgi:hypothetical protein